MKRSWLLVALAACGRDKFDPAHNYAFVTSTVHDPTTLGSDFSGADAICRDAASNAGLLGDYVAYLATNGVNATDRLGNARGWIRIDGKPFVDRVEDLAAGRIFTPLRIDELGEDLGPNGGQVATGAGETGRVSTGGDCNDWSSAANTYAYGHPEATTREWTMQGNSAPCTTAARLYCFGIGLDAPLEITPAPGRRAFVTVGAFVPGGGLAAADALCASEASLAGLPGTFQALLPTSGATAASRFDMGGPSWVRVDGVALASSAFAFMAGDLDAPLSVTSAGTDVAITVLTDGMPTQLDTGASAACTDWTATTGNARSGRSSFATANAFDQNSTTPCGGASIYCLER